jgi:hypothetical protein
VRVRFRGTFCGEERFGFAAQLRIFRASAIEEGDPFVLRKIGGLEEQVLDLLPAAVGFTAVGDHGVYNYSLLLEAAVEVQDYRVLLESVRYHDGPFGDLAHAASRRS